MDRSISNWMTFPHFNWSEMIIQIKFEAFQLNRFGRSHMPIYDDSQFSYVTHHIDTILLVVFIGDKLWRFPKIYWLVSVFLRKIMVKCNYGSHIIKHAFTKSVDKREHSFSTINSNDWLYLLTTYQICAWYYVYRWKIVYANVK